MVPFPSSLTKAMNAFNISPTKNESSPTVSSSSSSAPLVINYGLFHPSSSSSVLATSSTNKNVIQSKTNNQTRKLLSDQKAPFHHLKPKLILISTIRISLLQGTNILSTYLTDQLEHEMNNEEKLVLGQLTSKELDIDNSRWEEEEWNKRFKTLPKKIVEALWKFHAVTLLMRFYEIVICDGVLKINVEIMDLLTKDTFASALRKKERLNRYLISGPSKFRPEDSTSSNLEAVTIDRRNSSRSMPGYDTDSNGTANDIVASSDGCEVTSTRELGQQMFHTCLWSNAIGFLADHTVQQCILVYGYYVYCSSQRKKNRAVRLKNEANEDGDYEYDLKFKEEEKEDDMAEEEGDTTLSSNNNDSYFYGNNGGILLSFLIKSSKISVTKAFALVSASLGGAIGSMIRPGWGTTIGTQLGDALVGVILDD